MFAHQPTRFLQLNGHFAVQCKHTKLAQTVSAIKLMVNALAQRDCFIPAFALRFTHSEQIYHLRSYRRWISLAILRIAIFLHDPNLMTTTRLIKKSSAIVISQRYNLFGFIVLLFLLSRPKDVTRSKRRVSSVYRATGVAQGGLTSPSVSVDDAYITTRYLPSSYFLEFSYIEHFLVIGS